MYKSKIFGSIEIMELSSSTKTVKILCFEKSKKEIEEKTHQGDKILIREYENENDLIVRGRSFVINPKI